MSNNNNNNNNNNNPNDYTIPKKQRRDDKLGNNNNNNNHYPYGRGGGDRGHSNPGSSGRSSDDYYFGGPSRQQQPSSRYNNNNDYYSRGGGGSRGQPGLGYYGSSSSSAAAPRNDSRSYQYKREQQQQDHQKLPRDEIKKDVVAVKMESSSSNNNKDDETKVKMDIVMDDDDDDDDDPQEWKEHWKEMDAKTQMKKLLHDDTMAFLPEILELPSEEKVAKALMETKEKLKKELDKEEAPKRNQSYNEYYDDDDDDSDGGLVLPSEKKTSKFDLYVPFMDALTQCTPLNYGFHVVRILAHHSDEWCCCPCGKKLASWRKMIHSSFDDQMRDLGEEPCDDKKYSPKGLLDHLKSKQNGGWLHWIVGTYLHSLYKDYFKPGLHHKALYNNNDPNWKKAEIMEMLDVNKKIVELQKERVESQKKEAEREKYIKELEEGKNELANQLKHELANQLKQQKKIEEQLASLFQVEKVHHEVDTSPGKLKKYWKCRDNVFDLYRDLFREKLRKIKKNKSIESPRIAMEMPQSFNIRNFFEEWAEAEEPNELFCILDDLTCLKFLSQMDITFKVIAKVDNDEESLEQIAKDEGGPSRVFLSRIWQQLERVTVKGANEKSVSLFRKNPGGILVPQDDDMLCYSLLGMLSSDKSKEEAESLKEAVKEIVRPYYQAIGRILLHCLAVDNFFKIKDEETEFLERKHRYMIGGHALPSIYRNYLLRGVDPMDEDYELPNLLRDFIAIKDARNIDLSNISLILQGLGLDETKLESMKDDPHRQQKMFREIVKNSVIDEVSIALEALQQGLTLDGNVKTTMAFEFTPLEALDKMFFSPPHGATVNELISVIVAPDYSTDKHLEALQKKIFYRDSVTDEVSGYLPELLYEREKKREKTAGDFLEFVTGSRYLPQRPTECNFQIVIEFHQNMDPAAVPMAHTCVKVMKFPATAYNGDKETLLNKLVYALENKGIFLME